MRISRTADALAAAAALVLAGTGIAAGAASAADHTPPPPAPKPTPQTLCVTIGKPHVVRPTPPACKKGKEIAVPLFVDAPGQTLTWTATPDGPVLHVKPTPRPTPTGGIVTPLYTPYPKPTTSHEPWPTR